MVGCVGPLKGGPDDGPVVPTLHSSPPNDWNLTMVIKIHPSEDVAMTTQISAETLSPITHNQIPVITSELLAHLYRTTINNIKVNFTRNAERFIEGKHFFKVTGDELKNLRVTLSYLTKNTLSNPMDRAR